MVLCYEKFISLVNIWIDECTYDSNSTILNIADPVSEQKVYVAEFYLHSHVCSNLLAIWTNDCVGLVNMALIIYQKMLQT